MNQFYMKSMKKNESLYENSVKVILDLKSRLEDQEKKIKKAQVGQNSERIISKRLEKILEDEVIVPRQTKNFQNKL